MSMTVVLYGDDLLDVADELLDEMMEPAKQAVKDARDIVFDEVKRQLNRRSSGPSIAGEPPVRRSGDLERSFRKTPVRVKGRVIEAGFRTDHPGAMRLEVGFVDERGIRTLPHPYLRTSFEAKRDAVDARLEKL